jgi:hypothetical protein
MFIHIVIATAAAAAAASLQAAVMVLTLPPLPSRGRMPRHLTARCTSTAITTATAAITAVAAAVAASTGDEVQVTALLSLMTDHFIFTWYVPQRCVVCYL